MGSEREHEIYDRVVSRRNAEEGRAVRGGLETDGNDEGDASGVSVQKQDVAAADMECAEDQWQRSVAISQREWELARDDEEGSWHDEQLRQGDQDEKQSKPYTELTEHIG